MNGFQLHCLIILDRSFMLIVVYIHVLHNFYMLYMISVAF